MAFGAFSHPTTVISNPDNYTEILLTLLWNSIPSWAVATKGEFIEIPVCTDALAACGDIGLGSHQNQR